MPEPLRVYRARWIVPVSRPPIHQGFVATQGKRIVAVGTGPGPTGQRIELPDQALLPGLVNAHTHLEFSERSVPLTSSIPSFAAWLREVIAYRNTRADRHHALDPALSRGTTECQQRGVVAVGEITSSPWPISYVSSPQIVSFLEQLGLDQRVADERAQAVEQFLQQSRLAGFNGRLGISPHAPYSVHRDLFARLLRIADHWRLPIAMHVAESQEEQELLQTGQGPMRALLDDLGIWPGRAALTQWSEVIDSLPGTSRHLIVHGNYLDDTLCDRLAARSGHISVVYCPRTHQYFRHAPYRLVPLLRRQINVAIGTDSRASNPDLGVWEELQAVRRLHPEIPPAAILRMGTLSAAWALGLDQHVGSLEPGRSASMLTVQVDAVNEQESLWERLFDATAGAVRTHVDSATTPGS